MNISKIIGLIAAFIILLTASSGFFILNEQEQAIITQFGKPVGNPIDQPGVYFKTPFIQEVRFFEKRFLEWDGDRNQIPTKDKKFIFVDSFARWQITDALQFYLRLRDERGAQSRLDDILDGETRNAIANNELVDIVRNSNRTPLANEDAYELDDAGLDSIKVGRKAIEEMIQNRANEKATDLGIHILDFRLKRLNYVPEVQERVYDRMVSERNRIADKFRSEGQGEALRINGEKEKILNRIESQARRRAEEIRGEADARAAAVFNNAFNKNAQTRDFYDFLKTMETYETAFDENTTVILDTDTEFFKYLKRDN